MLYWSQNTDSCAPVLVKPFHQPHQRHDPKQGQHRTPQVGNSLGNQRQRGFFQSTESHSQNSPPSSSSSYCFIDKRLKMEMPCWVGNISRAVLAIYELPASSDYTGREWLLLMEGTFHHCVIWCEQVSWQPKQDIVIHDQYKENRARSNLVPLTFSILKPHNWWRVHLESLIETSFLLKECILSDNNICRRTMLIYNNFINIALKFTYIQTCMSYN